MNRRSFFKFGVAAPVIGVQSIVGTGAVAQTSINQCGQCNRVMDCRIEDDGAATAQCINQDCVRHGVKYVIPPVMMDMA